MCRVIIGKNVEVNIVSMVYAVKIERDSVEVLEPWNFVLWPEERID